MSTANRWLPFRRVAPGRRFRLFCFPNAGGGASLYRPWTLGALPEAIDVCPVQLPGREARLREQPHTRNEAVADALLEALADDLDLPFAFFGHSMGTAISFELAHRLRAAGKPEPSMLLVAGRRAPHLPPEDDPVHGLPDEALIDRLRSYGGTPPAVLEHPELMALVLPVLRADFELVETYEPVPRPPLTCPIEVLGGRQDEDADEAQLDAWRELTTGPFSVHLFDGGHFFVQDAREQVIATVNRALAPLLAQS